MTTGPFNFLLLAFRQGQIFLPSELTRYPVADNSDPLFLLAVLFPSLVADQAKFFQCYLSRLGPTPFGIYSVQGSASLDKRLTPKFFVICKMFLQSICERSQLEASLLIHPPCRLRSADIAGTPHRLLHFFSLVGFRGHLLPPPSVAIPTTLNPLTPP